MALRGKPASSSSTPHIAAPHRQHRSEWPMGGGGGRPTRCVDKNKTSRIVVESREWRSVRGFPTKNTFWGNTTTSLVPWNAVSPRSVRPFTRADSRCQSLRHECGPSLCISLERITLPRLFIYGEGPGPLPGCGVCMR